MCIRDRRITTIYEGTTGIQANDLIGRKLGRDRGAAMGALILEMQTELAALEGSDAVMRTIKHSAIEAVDRLSEATDAILEALDVYKRQEKDRAKYVAIGEADNFVLKFRKPKHS